MGFISFLLLMWIFSRDCIGGVVFVFIEWIIVDVPKSPVSRGRSGCSKFKLKVLSPKNPAKTKIRIDFIFSFPV